MNKLKVKSLAPNGATHYLILMFLGLVYLKYINGYSYWFDESIKKWIPTKAYTDGTPL